MDDGQHDQHTPRRSALLGANSKHRLIQRQHGRRVALPEDAHTVPAREAVRQQAQVVEQRQGRRKKKNKKRNKVRKSRRGKGRHGQSKHKKKKGKLNPTPADNKRPSVVLGPQIARLETMMEET